MRAIEIMERSIPSNTDDVKDWLAGLGWESVSGYYADVYSKPGMNYVIKVFERDSAYLAFLNLVKHNPNPHFPKVLGKVWLRDYSREYNAVRLEKLVPTAPVQVGPYRVAVSGMLSAYVLNKTHNLNSVQERNLEMAQEYLADKPELVTALDLISTLLDRHSLDLNHDNIMQRGDTVVIIDPVSGRA